MRITNIQLTRLKINHLIQANFAKKTTKIGNDKEYLLSPQELEFELLAFLEFLLPAFFFFFLFNASNAQGCIQVKTRK